MPIHSTLAFPEQNKLTRLSFFTIRVLPLGVIVGDAEPRKEKESEVALYLWEPLANVSFITFELRNIKELYKPNLT